MITEDKIREVALRSFTLKGFRGTSLADISSEVGIKKQSIYHYFKSKDDLFISMFLQAAQNELLFVKNYLLREEIYFLEDLLYGFLVSYKQRYEEEEDTKFFFKFSFFPPEHLLNILVEYSGQYLKQIALLLEDVFEKGESTGQISKEVSVKHASSAFEAVMDAMFVEMLYNGLESSIRRLDASWYVYWRGVKS
ncbi:TetR/AcrR family transcriptional regulator [Paenibacillus polymyxa]|uniref:TetR/AcrR family transcriptional regulator n=1 Tax=Paenibacillus polymyxa TaxID=1406 RepID=UPI002ED112BA|nr:TetR/AcrR family transcriptional regulator [Paenibacillus polymyxa]